MVNSIWTNETILRFSRYTLPCLHQYNNKLFSFKFRRGRYRSGWLTIIHIYTVLFLGTEGLAENYIMNIIHGLDK